jgi:hypothetical protein
MENATPDFYLFPPPSRTASKALEMQLFSLHPLESDPPTEGFKILLQLYFPNTILYCKGIIFHHSNHATS